MTDAIVVIRSLNTDTKAPKADKALKPEYSTVEQALSAAAKALSTGNLDSDKFAEVGQQVHQYEGQGKGHLEGSFKKLQELYLTRAIFKAQVAIDQEYQDLQRLADASEKRIYQRLDNPSLLRDLDEEKGRTERIEGAKGLAMQVAQLAALSQRVFKSKPNSDLANLTEKFSQLQHLRNQFSHPAFDVAYGALKSYADNLRLVKNYSTELHDKVLALSKKCSALVGHLNALIASDPAHKVKLGAAKAELLNEGAKLSTIEHILANYKSLKEKINTDPGAITAAEVEGYLNASPHVSKALRNEMNRELAKAFEAALVDKVLRLPFQQHLDKPETVSAFLDAIERFGNAFAAQPSFQAQLQAATALKNGIEVYNHLKSSIADETLRVPVDVQQKYQALGGNHVIEEMKPLLRRQIETQLRAKIETGDGEALREYIGKLSAFLANIPGLDTPAIRADLERALNIINPPAEEPVMVEAEPERPPVVEQPPSPVVEKQEVEPAPQKISRWQAFLAWWASWTIMGLLRGCFSSDPEPQVEKEVQPVTPVFDSVTAPAPTRVVPELPVYHDQQVDLLGNRDIR